MTHSDLCEARLRDVYRLAKWLGLEYERREDEPATDYRKRLIIQVALRTRRRMLVEPELVAAQGDVVE